MLQVMLLYPWKLINSCSFKMHMQLLRENNIVPDIINKTVNEKTEINYRQGRNMVELGNLMNPTDTKDPPILRWTSDPNVLYFICMIDPDMPNPQKPRLKQFLHWLVGNIPGDDVAMGDVLSAYVGPIPFRDSGIHRYVFLIFRQNKELDFDDFIIMRKAKFNIKEFARKHQLGEPIAVNFFRSQHDNQVDINLLGFKDTMEERVTESTQMEPSVLQYSINASSIL